MPTNGSINEAGESPLPDLPSWGDFDAAANCPGNDDGAEEWWDDGGGEYDDENVEGEFEPIPDDEEEMGAGGGAGASDVSPPAFQESGGGSTTAKNPRRRGGPGKPRSTIPKWLQGDYKDRCELLRKEMHSNPSRLPSCYDLGQFVITPPAPIFMSSRHRQLTPRMFYQPTYFVWLPHLFHRIPCPACQAAGRKRANNEPVLLQVKGWPRMPRRVVDIEANLFIIGHRYLCGDSSCRRTYQSWSPAILNAIPSSVAAHFTHHLTFRNGLTDRLATLLRSCFQRGLGPSPFTDMIRTFHIRRYENLHIQYAEMVKARMSATASGFLALHEPFGSWDDINGYSDSVPSHSYFRGFYDTMIEKHADEIDQHMAMLPARILSIDHSFKVSSFRLSASVFYSAVLTPVGPKASRKSEWLSRLQCASLGCQQPWRNSHHEPNPN
jgi:hypothetical protein